MGKEVDISGNLTINKGSHMVIDPESEILVKGTDQQPFYIQKVQNIAPIAAHIKEVNHIDPLTVESLDVSRVKNIEPLRIEKLNVTNLPTVNMSLRQIPPVELSIRRLPALSVGTHQIFDVPSHYTVRARLLGLEVLRVQLNGCTRIGPRELFRREQERTPERSFPVAATAGNPAIPSIHIETEAHAGVCCGAPQTMFPISKSSESGG